MKRILIKLNLSFMFSLLIISCTTMPSISVVAKDDNGKPLISEVSVVSSKHIFLTHNNRIETNDRRKIVNGETDENGIFTFQYRVTKQTSWIKKIFGVKKIPIQNIKVSYELKSGIYNEFILEVHPK